MRDWIAYARQAYLDEFIRRDGLGNCATPGPCHSCEQSTGTIRCMECSGSMMLCDKCALDSHKRNPLHRLEVWLSFPRFTAKLTSQRWSEGYFQRCSLTELGMVIHMGHPHGPCPAPLPLNENFIVLAMNGIHELQLEYCGCSQGGHLERFQQLLREALFPASFDRPRTAFTFDVLDTYHKLTLQGKLNLFDFYFGILHKTDNCGRTKKTVSSSLTHVHPIDADSTQYRYHELSRCIRQWRHLKMAKRGGSAHLTAGIEATPQGSLAVECPTCPHPGRNMPTCLDQTPPEKRYVFCLPGSNML